MKYKEWQYENKNGIQQNYLHDTQYCSYKMQPFLIISIKCIHHSVTGFWNSYSLVSYLQTLLIQITTITKNTHTHKQKQSAFKQLRLKGNYYNRMNQAVFNTLRFLCFNLNLLDVLDVTCVMMPYCQQNMPLTWYCKIYFWQFSVMSQWHV
jgi:hypothetical protein